MPKFASVRRAETPLEKVTSGVGAAEFVCFFLSKIACARSGPSGRELRRKDRESSGNEQQVVLKRLCTNLGPPLAGRDDRSGSLLLHDTSVASIEHSPERTFPS